MPVYTRHYKQGQVIFEEGSPSRSIFMIKKGAVSIRKAKGKTPIDLGKIKANEIIGELSFFDRQPRSATAIALIDVEAIEIPFESLDKIYESIPDYMKTIMAAMADRLRKANDTIRMLQKQAHHHNDGSDPPPSQ